MNINCSMHVKVGMTSTILMGSWLKVIRTQWSIECVERKCDVYTCICLYMCMYIYYIYVYVLVCGGMCQSPMCTGCGFLHYDYTYIYLD